MIDKKDKIEKKDFDQGISELIPEKTNEFLTLINSKNFEEFISRLPQNQEVLDKITEVREVMARLEKLGITNTVFDQTLMRGFDYYTGIVFEVYDKNPKNPRSVFGGGRYDDLLSIFGGDKVPAVGFGMGDVVIKDILENYQLMPVQTNKTKLAICVFSADYLEYAEEIAQKLREKNINVLVDFSNRKIGDQIKNADKQKIPYIICVGEDELKSAEFKVKNLKTGEEKVVKQDSLADNLNF